MASSLDYQAELGICIRWLKRHLQEMQDIDASALKVRIFRSVMS